MTDVLVQLHFNGNNAWADSWGKSRAGHLLDDLESLLSPEQNTADFITGWMIANGSNGRAAENLHKIVAGRRNSRGGRRR
ncbi:MULTISPECIES: hypothetical protein [Saccharothrix]|uniref:hypothetical protein n=1 Tax=Saccharothrix TaxID=2071 RepID=UPI001160EB4A|nr:hypothetical protein [Saccharothrix sp. CB00851]